METCLLTARTNTRKEEMLAAIQRKSVSRCPHVAYNIHPYTSNEHTNDPSYSDILFQIGETAGVAVKAKTPGLGAGISGLRGDCVETSTTCENDSNLIRTTIHTPKGDLVGIKRTYPDTSDWIAKHLVCSNEDIDRYLSIPYEPPVFDVSGLKSLENAIGGNGVIFVNFPEPMFEIASLLHYEEFCIKVHTDLQSMKRLVEWAFERCADAVRLLTQACSGMDCIFHAIGPELCTPPMLAPEVFNQLVTPHMKKLIQIVHDAGMLAAIHCHGRVKEVFPMILETGADLLEPIEPVPQGNVSLEELLKEANGRICLMGHVQDQDFYTAPQGHMTNWVEQIARLVEGRTGFIMSPTCTPFDHPCTDTYKRNYVEWLTAADKLL